MAFLDRLLGRNSREQKVPGAAFSTTPIEISESNPPAELQAPSFMPPAEGVEKRRPDLTLPMVRRTGTKTSVRVRIVGAAVSLIAILGLTGLVIVVRMERQQQELVEKRERAAVACLRLATQEEERGEWEKALGHYRICVEQFEGLTHSFPGVPGYRRYLAHSHNSIGLLLRNAGDLSSARKELERALAIRGRLAADLPSVATYRQEFAASHYNVGLILRDQGERTRAGEEFELARETQEKLVADCPTLPDCRRELALSHYVLSDLSGRAWRPGRGPPGVGAGIDNSGENYRRLS
jgi:tetratricopeptide (TPR) repeat protein